MRHALLLCLLAALPGCDDGSSTSGVDPDAMPSAMPDAMGAMPDAMGAMPDAMPDATGATPDAMPPAIVDAGQPPAHPWEDHPLLVPGPLVIAHRGGRRIAPECTLVAYDMSWSGGVDVLEADLHATADGVVVVMHDDTVDRTTDGTGAIREMTLEELRALDAGYRFRENDGAPYRGMGLTVPTLDELLAAFPEAPLSLEIKQDDPPIIDEVVAALDAHDARGRVVVASFSDAVTRGFRAAAPDVLTAMALGEIVSWITLPPGPDARPWTPGGHFLQVPLEQAGFELVTEATVTHARRHGVRMHPWTINDPAEMRRLLDLGVAGIITDDPFVLRDLIHRPE